MEVSIARADRRGSAPELLWQSRRRNTPLARHRRHLRIMRELARDLNLARPTEAERMLLSQAAALALQSERLRAAIVAGTTVDHESLVKLASEQRRILTVLAKRAPPKRAGPTLGDLLREGQDDRQSAE